MTIEQTPLWLAVLSLLGSGGGLIVFYRVLAHWMDHLLKKRKQSDDVAMDMVSQLRAERSADRDAFNSEIQVLRAELVSERTSCDAQLTVIRHRLANELTHSDALELAIRHAPDKAVEILDHARQMRSERAAQQRHDELGALRAVYQQRASEEALAAA